MAAREVLGFVAGIALAVQAFPVSAQPACVLPPADPADRIVVFGGL